MNWDNVKSSAIPTAQTMSRTLVTGTVNVASNLIKIEILRDFWQIISLLFEGLGDALPQSFRNLIGSISGAISFCFSCWFNTADVQKWIAVGVFASTAITAIIASGIFYWITRRDPNENNQGLDMTSWSMKSTGYRRKLRLLLLLLTTLYLPVFRDSMLSLTCDLTFFPNEGDCDGSLYTYLFWMSVVVLLVYVVPLPLVLWRVVIKNKPTTTLFDAEGDLRVGGYTKGDYRADLDKDKSPYKPVYNGYERDWSTYKVIVMGIKILLVAPVVLLTTTNTIGGRTDDEDKSLMLYQSLTMLVVLAVYALLSSKSKPFIEDSDNRANIIEQWSALLVAALGFAASQIDGMEVVFGIVLNIVSIVSGAILFLYTIAGIDKVKTKLRTMGQRVHWTLTRDTLKPLLFSGQLDIGKERKVRIWHEFWDTLIAQDEGLRIPNKYSKAKDDKYKPKHLGYQYGRSPPFLLDFKGTVGERHAENLEIVANESFASYQSGLTVGTRADLDPLQMQLMQSMKYIVANLHGVDVFWDGPCVHLKGDTKTEIEAAKETENLSPTKFGKMYIKPHPFCARFVSDDREHSEALFSAAPVVAGKVFDAQRGIQKLNMLVARNQDPEIQRRKGVRLRLRALEGSMCRWQIQKWIDKKVTKRSQSEDGSDEEKTIRVLFTFNNGKFGISRNKEKVKWEDVDVTRGFAANLQYRDGTGSHNESGWEPRSWSNEEITVYGEDFGLNERFENTPRFNEFMRNYRMDTHEAKRQEIMAQFTRYSRHWSEQFVGKEKVLSYAFWYYVYNDDELQREDLVQCLRMEQNEKIRAMASDGEYLESVAMVYDKLRFFNRSERHAVWFIFWHDLWMNNMKMKPFEENEELLSPFKPSSICYEFVADKAELVTRLEHAGICGDAGCLRKGWINTDYIEKLYELMDSMKGPSGDGDEERKEQQIEIGKSRKTGTVRLSPELSFVDEYGRASSMVTRVCADNNGWNNTLSAAGQAGAVVTIAPQQVMAGQPMQQMQQQVQQPQQGQPVQYVQTQYVQQGQGQRVVYQQPQGQTQIVYQQQAQPQQGQVVYVQQPQAQQVMYVQQGQPQVVYAQQRPAGQ